RRPSGSPRENRPRWSATPVPATTAGSRYSSNDTRLAPPRERASEPASTSSGPDLAPSSGAAPRRGVPGTVADAPGRGVRARESAAGALRLSLRNGCPALHGDRFLPSLL